MKIIQYVLLYLLFCCPLYGATAVATQQLATATPRLTQQIAMSWTAMITRAKNYFKPANAHPKTKTWSSAGFKTAKRCAKYVASAATVSFAQSMYSRPKSKPEPKSATLEEAADEPVGYGTWGRNHANELLSEVEKKSDNPQVQELCRQTRDLLHRCLNWQTAMFGSFERSMHEIESIATILRRGGRVLPIELQSRVQRILHESAQHFSGGDS